MDEQKQEGNVIEKKVFVFVVHGSGFIHHTAVFNDEAESELYAVLFLRENYPEYVQHIRDETGADPDSFYDFAINWPEDSDINWDIYIERVFNTSAAARSWYNEQEQNDEG